MIDVTDVIDVTDAIDVTDWIEREDLSSLQKPNWHGGWALRRPPNLWFFLLSFSFTLVPSIPNTTSAFQPLKRGKEKEGRWHGPSPYEPRHDRHHLHTLPLARAKSHSCTQLRARLGTVDMFCASDTKAYGECGQWRAACNLSHSEHIWRTPRRSLWKIWK